MIDGGVPEWSIGLVLKTSVPKGTVGSNPTPSATKENTVRLRSVFFCIYKEEAELPGIRKGYLVFWEIWTKILETHTAHVMREIPSLSAVES